MLSRIRAPHSLDPANLNIAREAQTEMITLIEKAAREVDDVATVPFELLLPAAQRPDAWIELVEERGVDSRDAG